MKEHLKQGSEIQSSELVWTTVNIFSIKYIINIIICSYKCNSGLHPMAAVTEQFANKPTRVQSSHRLVNLLKCSHVEHIISKSDFGCITLFVPCQYSVRLGLWWDFSVQIQCRLSVFLIICCRRVDYSATWVTASWYVDELSGWEFPQNRIYWAWVAS